MEAARIALRLVALRLLGLWLLLLASTLLVASGLVHAASPARAPGTSSTAHCQLSDAPQTAGRASAGYPEVWVCRDKDTAWIVVSQSVGSKRKVTESAHFRTDQGRFGYGLGVEAVVVDAIDRFHIQLTYGSAGAPNSDVFRFAWRDGAWRLAGRDFSTLASCADGSIDYSSRYSVNYPTGLTVATLYHGCRPYRTVRASLRVASPTLQGFDPLDSALRPQALANYF